MEMEMEVVGNGAKKEGTVCVCLILIVDFRRGASLFFLILSPVPFGRDGRCG